MMTPYEKVYGLSMMQMIELPIASDTAALSIVNQERRHSLDF